MCVSLVIVVGMLLVNWIALNAVMRLNVLLL